jgi:hypothetical protein
MRTIKEHQIKLTGSASIPQALTTGKSYTMALELVCNGIDITDNEDGSDTYKYKCRPFGNVVITNTEGKQIKTVMKGKKSVALRLAIENWFDSKDRDCDFDSFYAREMDKIISDINGRNY